MASIDLDFDLEIGLGSGNQYPVAVLRSPAGPVRETMRFPFSDRSLANHLSSLQSDLLSRRSTGQDFGRRLFDALFSEDVYARYEESQRQAANMGRALRLTLRIQPLELASLPWELLYDSHAGEYICSSGAANVIRYVDLPQAAPLPSVTPPLRILGMVAAPHGLPQPKIAREKQRMEDALGSLQSLELVEVAWMEGQSWRDLQQAIWSDRWHAFHFVGHGGIDESTGEGFIVLAGDDGQSQNLGTRHLSWLLASHESLRLVWLRSRDASQGSGRDRFASIAAALVQRGIPAVLTTPYAIAEQATVTLAQNLYEALVAGLPLDLAMARARAAIQSEGPGTMEWAVTALHTHLPEVRLLDRADVIATAHRRGDEAFAADDFERAIDQYTLAVEMGGDQTVQEKKGLAEGVTQKLGHAQSKLGALSGSAETQAVEIAGILEDLNEIKEQLPNSQVAQHEFIRAQEKATGLRDRLWKRGQRLLRRASAGLTVDGRRKRLQTSLRLLEAAAQLDTEELPALGEDRAKVERRLEYLQSGQLRAGLGRGRQLRVYAIAAAATVCALVVFLLATELVPLPTLVARATPTASLTPGHTAAPDAGVTSRVEATQILVPGPTSTASPALAPTGAATPTSAHTASPEPTHTRGPTTRNTEPPTPTLPAPSPTRRATATRTPSATPTRQPSATPAAQPVPATRTPRPTPSPRPTATPTLGIIYPAAVLLEPEDIAYLSQEAFGTYRLGWTWDGILQEDEWFDVRVWQVGMPHYGIAWTKQREYKYDICLRVSGQYYWSVAVIRGSRGQWLADLSPEATPHRFTTSRYDSWCEKHGRELIPPDLEP
jgi:hypothetical protein